MKNGVIIDGILFVPQKRDLRRKDNLCDRYEIKSWRNVAFCTGLCEFFGHGDCYFVKSQLQLNKINA